MKLTAVSFALAGTLLVATPALAASDYLLELDGVKGESAAPVAVDSWSFGVCNAGQCSSIVSPRDLASGMPTGKAAGKGRPSTASWDLATSKGGRIAAPGTAANGAVAAGDLDGDGKADFAFVSSQSEVSSLSLNFTKITVEYRQVCQGKHITKATLRSSADSFEVSDATVSCTFMPDNAQNRYLLGLRGTALKTVGGCDGGASSGACDMATDGILVMRFASGKITQTSNTGKKEYVGHVTLIK